VCEARRIFLRDRGGEGQQNGGGHQSIEMTHVRKVIAISEPIL
jgi:hypothetical protein